MGLEFKIETYDAERVMLPDFLRGLPEFLREDGDLFHLGTDSSTILLTVRVHARHIYLCHHVACLFGLTLLGWIGYNLFIERLPATQGRNPLPAVILSFACLGVGYKWMSRPRP